jgi:parallel beta-helix repeat protein
MTWSVSPSGSDANLGTSQFPFRTISRAATVATSGDTVVVEAGRYTETVNLYSRNSGVEFRGVGAGRPVIDGAGRRAYGFHNRANRVTITGFAITGQTDAGIYTEGSNDRVADNVLHHIGSSDEERSNGVRVIGGSGNTISGNTVHHIGPGFSSMGIWLVETRDALVEGNSVYLVRKEGIRDWKGLDNVVAGNHAFLNWVGIGLNTSTGSSVRNNYVSDNVEGLAVKHASYRTVLDFWDLDQAHWSRVEHNTVQRSSEASIWIAQSDEPLDYVEVTGNHFAGAGGAFLRDIPSLRGAHVTVDANAYTDAGWTPRWLYKAGWSSAGGLTDWASVRRETGWETTPAAADAGATGDSQATASWTQFDMTPVDSSSKGTYYTRNHLGATSDNDQTTYWMTDTNRDEYVVFDFGQPRTFDHLILTLYSNEDKRNPRSYRFSVSDDRSSWRSILSGVNQDTSQAARYYELREPVTARYLRFTMVDNFCDTYLPRLGCGENFVLSDLKAGLVSPQAPSALASEPEIGMAPKAVLTRRGTLRIHVTCDGTAAGPARFVVGRAGRKRVELGPDCSRAVEIPLRRRFVRRLRRGEVRHVRVTATAPGDRLTKRLRVRT